GTSWSQTSISGAKFLAVWGAAANDAYAVGVETISGSTYGVIYHFDGVSWTSVVSLLNAGAFNGIWGSGTSDVFAVGSSGKIYHYDGLGWTSTIIDPTITFTGAWGSGSNNVYAVGRSGPVNSQVG